MAFASLGAPYFNYLSTACGIPHLEVRGSESDWVKLYEMVAKLRNMGPKCSESYYLKHHDNHIDKSLNAIANIVHYCFGKSMPTFEKIGGSAEEFFSDVFHYGANTKCGSGHDAYIVKGWLKYFYGDFDGDLDKFRTHSNYVCMQNMDNEKFYCQVVSLAYSNYDATKHLLEPHYGIVTYEILNRQVYNELAMIPPEVDSKGRQYVPLTKSELKEIVEKGKLYDPATLHYGYGGHVICDKCRRDITVAIGYSINNDLCLECVEEVKSWN